MMGYIQVITLTILTILLFSITGGISIFRRLDNKAILLQNDILSGLEDLGAKVENVAKLSGYTALIIDDKLMDYYQQFKDSNNMLDITNTLVESAILLEDKKIALKALPLSEYYDIECNKILDAFEGMGSVRRFLWYLFHTKVPTEYLQKKFSKLIKMSQGLKQVNEKYNAENLSWDELKVLEKRITERKRKLNNIENKV